MERIEIGDIALIPSLNDAYPRIWVSLENDGGGVSPWSVAGVQAVITYLQAWLAEQEGPHGTN